MEQLEMISFRGLIGKRPIRIVRTLPLDLIGIKAVLDDCLQEGFQVYLFPPTNRHMYSGQIFLT
jgi:hypothetical protein